MDSRLQTRSGSSVSACAFTISCDVIWVVELLFGLIPGLGSRLSLSPNFTLYQRDTDTIWCNICSSFPILIFGSGVCPVGNGCQWWLTNLLSLPVGGADVFSRGFWLILGSTFIFLTRALDLTVPFLWVDLVLLPWSVDVYRHWKSPGSGWGVWSIPSPAVCVCYTMYKHCK